MSKSEGEAKGGKGKGGKGKGGRPATKKVEAVEEDPSGRCPPEPEMLGLPKFPV